MNKNSLIKKTAGVAASLALVVGAAAMASSPAAADDTPTDVEIIPGELSAGLGSVSFLPVEFSYDDRETPSEARLDVTDERGSDAGWSIIAEASNLEHEDYNPGAPDPTLLIPNSGLSYTGFNDFTSDNGALMGTPGQLDIPTVLMGAEAGDGAGDSSAAIGFELSVPGATQLGIYTGEITYTVGGAYVP